MKPQHLVLFDTIKKSLLESNISIFVYFIERKTNRIISGELKIENRRPYIYLDDNLVKQFESINFQEIYENIESRYREQWKNSYKEVDFAVKGNKLVKLNPLCSGFWGPYFNPKKRSQSFNVYTTLFFKVKEIEKLNIDLDKLYRVEKIYISPDEYISINDLSNIVTQSSEKKDYGYNGLKQNQSIDGYKAQNDMVEVYDDDLETIKIRKIKLKNFVNFNEVDQEFSSGINLIIGENGTGKTTLLKFIYGSIKGLETYNRKKLNRDFGTIKENLSVKLYNVYKEPEKGLGALISINSKEQKLEASVTLGDNTLEGEINFSFDKQITREIINVELSSLLDYENNEGINDLYNTLFIPSKEILGIYRAVKFTVNQQRLDFDDTYFDLANCIELSAVEPDYMKTVIEDLEKIIHGKIEYRIKESKFVFISEDQIYEMAMTAEGVKQIGVLITLLKNRELRENTILFLDEPDTNLNPSSIRPFVKIMVELAKKDIQIFIATHNSFVLKQLEICAKQNNEVPIFCYSLHKNQHNNKINIESIDLKLGQPENNAINDEALDMFDEDIKTELGQ